MKAIQEINAMIKSAADGASAANAAHLAKPSHSPPAQNRPLTVAGRGNNIYNMRNYKQKWQGEISDGVGMGGFLGFKNKYYATRAASRLIQNKLMKMKLQDRNMYNLMKSYSPPTENDLEKHVSNLEKLTGLTRSQALNPLDNDQMFRLMTGLAIAESGNSSLKGLKSNDILNAIMASRTSVRPVSKITKPAKKVK